MVITLNRLFPGVGRTKRKEIKALARMRNQLAAQHAVVESLRKTIDQDHLLKELNTKENDHLKDTEEEVDHQREDDRRTEEDPLKGINHLTKLLTMMGYQNLGVVFVAWEINRKKINLKETNHQQMATMKQSLDAVLVAGEINRKKINRLKEINHLNELMTTIKPNTEGDHHQEDDRHQEDDPLKGINHLTKLLMTMV